MTSVTQSQNNISRKNTIIRSTVSKISNSFYFKKAARTAVFQIKKPKQVIQLFQKKPNLINVGTAWI